MTIPVGVVGVGSMGRHHARVYRELSEARLVGVTDVDQAIAADVAQAYDTRPMSFDELMKEAAAVSVVVPSRHHHKVATTVLERGVHALVEKPLATTVEEAESIVETAATADVTLQVGHVERFNPAVRTVASFVDDLDIVALDARRLGPPVDDGRDVGDGVVLDLMIHDLDVITALVDDHVTNVAATGSPDRQYVTAMLDFQSDVVASVTASRVTQRKVRELAITAADCQITLDYIDRSIRIHRQTRPEFFVDDGDLRYRSEQIVERPTVDNGEPLKAELVSFIDAVSNGHQPVVDGADGINALKLAHRVRAVLDEQSVPTPVGELR